MVNPKRGVTTAYVEDRLSPVGCVTIHDATLAALHRAVITRVFCVKQKGVYVPCPKPIEGVFGQLSHFKRLVVKSYRKLGFVPLEGIPDMYKGAKRLRYQRALSSIYTLDVNERDAHVRAFTKVEKLVLDSYLEDKDPRIISPRDARFNICLAQYLKPNESTIFKAINDCFGAISQSQLATVMKGLNADERGAIIFKKWARFCDPVAIRMDFSRFDQHVSQEALRYEHRFYIDMPHWTMLQRRQLIWLLKQQLVTHGLGVTKDGILSWTRNGGRCSGDMNTGLGNVIIVCAMMFTYLEMLAIRAEVINDGDDCAVIVERTSLPIFMLNLKKYMCDFGFEIKTEGFADELEQLKFCQSVPIEITPGVWRMVRDPRASIIKDVVAIQPLVDKRSYDRWRSAISGCGIALTSGVPVVQDFYCALGFGTDMEKLRDKNGDLVLNCGMDYLALRMEGKWMPCHDVARISFCKAFGISPSTQVLMEQWYSEQRIGYRPEVCLSYAESMLGNYRCPMDSCTQMA